MGVMWEKPSSLGRAWVTIKIVGTETRVAGRLGKVYIWMLVVLLGEVYVTLLGCGL